MFTEPTTMTRPDIARRLANGPADDHEQERQDKRERPRSPEQGADENENRDHIHKAPSSP
jgi:hypothetical protein